MNQPVQLNQPILLIGVVVLIVLVLVVAVLLPRMFNQAAKQLRARLTSLQQDLAVISAEHDSEKRQLKLQKFVSTLDNFIGQLLTYYGCYDQSVNKQIRMAMERKLITYEDFKVVKEFHHMRNRIIHEDHTISSSDENTIFTTFSIVRRLLG